MNELLELRQLAGQIDMQQAVSLYNKVDKEIERLNNKIAELEKENAVLKTQIVNKDRYTYGIR